jgi:hypothetical protein
MRLSVALPVLALLLGGGVAGSAAPAAPTSITVENAHVTCVDSYSAAICRVDPPSWPDSAIYTGP